MSEIIDKDLSVAVYLNKNKKNSTISLSAFISAHPNLTIAETYVEKKAGKTKPELERAFMDAQKGSFQCLLVPRLSEFGKLENALLEIKRFAQLSPPVSMYFIHEAIDTVSPKSKQALKILYSLVKGEKLQKNSARR